MHRTKVFLFLLSSALWSMGAEGFVFVHRPGDEYRILSTVDQEVYVNGVFSHNAWILNKITARVLEVDAQKGILDASYITTEESRIPGEVFKRSNTYDVVFSRDRLGYLAVPPEAFVPTVRDVPVFPDRPLKPGDTWSAMGSEAHDFRTSLGVETPLIFPMKVNYRYEGPVTEGERTFHRITASYQVLHRFPRRGLQDSTPQQVSGNSRQSIYWDPIAGRPDHYDEEYFFVFSLANGTSVVFQGTAEARVVEAREYPSAALEESLETVIQEENLADVTLRQDEDGLTLALENIQFAPDSAELLPGEYDKLRALAEVLARYPEYDLLVTGHTALAGDAAGRQTLSEQRARVVGQFLLEQKIRRQDQVMYQGKGATEPIGDNDTEEGRRRNRRVEITILKN